MSPVRSRLIVLSRNNQLPRLACTHDESSPSEKLLFLSGLLWTSSMFQCCSLLQQGFTVITQMHRLYSFLSTPTPDAGVSVPH